MASSSQRQDTSPSSAVASSQFHPSPRSPRLPRRTNRRRFSVGRRSPQPLIATSDFRNYPDSSSKPPTAKRSRLSQPSPSPPARQLCHQDSPASSRNVQSPYSDKHKIVRSTRYNVSRGADSRRTPRTTGYARPSSSHSATPSHRFPANPYLCLGSLPTSPRDRPSDASPSVVLAPIMLHSTDGPAVRSHNISCPTPTVVPHGPLSQAFASDRHELLRAWQERGMQRMAWQDEHGVLHQPPLLQVEEVSSNGYVRPASPTVQRSPTTLVKKQHGIDRLHPKHRIQRQMSPPVSLRPTVTTSSPSVRLGRGRIALSALMNPVPTPTSRTSRSRTKHTKRSDASSSGCESTSNLDNGNKSESGEDAEVKEERAEEDVESAATEGSRARTDVALLASTPPQRYSTVPSAPVISTPAQESPAFPSSATSGPPHSVKRPTTRGPPKFYQRGLEIYGRPLSLCSRRRSSPMSG